MVRKAATVIDMTNKGSEQKGWITSKQYKIEKFFFYYKIAIKSENHKNVYSLI